jgi:tRNA A37 methylthiotransferase MiaB
MLERKNNAKYFSKEQRSKRIMAKNKKIKASAIVDAMGTSDVQHVVLTIGTGENQMEIQVKTYLPLIDRVSMTQDIVDAVFVEAADGNVDYYPSLTRFAIEYAIVNRFTNISLPSNSKSAWEFLDTTKIVDRIFELPVGGYIAEIVLEAKDLIQFRKTQLSKRSKLDDLIDSIGDVMKTINAKTQNAGFSDIVGALKEYMPEFKDDIEKLIKKEAEGGAE